MLRSEVKRISNAFRESCTVWRQCIEGETMDLEKIVRTHLQCGKPKFQWMEVENCQKRFLCSSFYVSKIHGSKSSGIRTKCEIRDYIERPMTPSIAIEFDWKQRRADGRINGNKQTYKKKTPKTELFVLLMHLRNFSFNPICCWLYVL